MTKVTTSISIDDSLILRYKDKNPRGSFSAYVEDVLRRDMGNVVSEEDLKAKIIEANETLIYLMDKQDELIRMKKMEFINKTEYEKREIEKAIEERELKIQDAIDKVKDIEEIKTLVEIVREDKNKITDTKFMVDQVNILREKYPNLRIGVIQLRDALNRLV